MKKIKDLLGRQYTPEKILLAAHALGRGREFVLARPEYRPTPWERLKIRYYFYRLGHGYSVAAIVRRREFYGLDFYVNKKVLIPRPETELMVAAVLEKITPDDTLIDVGTGSGCVLISILKNCPVRRACGLDISAAALRVARRNARYHRVRANFAQSDLLAKMAKEKLSGNIFITANLPYLTAKQFRESPTIQKEPRRALVADSGGLGLYERLLEQVANVIPSEIVIPTETSPDGASEAEESYCKTYLFLEIDPSQTEKITALITRHFPAAQVTIKKDLSGQDRLVEIILSS